MSNFLINKHFTHVGNNQFFSSFPHDNILSCPCSPKPLTHLHPFINKKIKYFLSTPTYTTPPSKSKTLLLHLSKSPFMNQFLLLTFESCWPTHNI